MLRIVQLSHSEHGRRVAVVEEPRLRLLRDCHRFMSWPHRRSNRTVVARGDRAAQF